MMKIYINLLIALFLYSCSNEQSERLSNKDNHLKKEEFKHPSFKRTRNSDECDFKVVDNFNCPIGDLYFDSIHSLFLSDKNSRITSKIGLGGGDFYMCYQLIENKKNKLYLFKSDSGEYGFSNTQFIVDKGKIVFYRHFNLGLNEIGTDSTKTTWLITENTYYFKNQFKTKEFNRSDSLNSYFSAYKMNDFKVVKIQNLDFKKDSYLDLEKELKSLINMRDFD